MSDGPVSIPPEQSAQLQAALLQVARSLEYSRSTTEHIAGLVDRSLAVNARFSEAVQLVNAEVHNAEIKGKVNDLHKRYGQLLLVTRRLAGKAQSATNDLWSELLEFIASPSEADEDKIAELDGSVGTLKARSVDARDTGAKFGDLCSELEQCDAAILAAIRREHAKDLHVIDAKLREIDDIRVEMKWLEGSMSEILRVVLSYVGGVLWQLVRGVSLKSGVKLVRDTVQQQHFDFPPEVDANFNENATRLEDLKLKRAILSRELKQECGIISHKKGKVVTIPGQLTDLAADLGSLSTEIVTFVDVLPQLETECNHIKHIISESTGVARSRDLIFKISQLQQLLPTLEKAQRAYAVARTSADVNVEMAKPVRRIAA